MTQSHAERRRRSRPEGGPDDPLIGAAPVTREEFSAGFERCLRRVYAYVSRRVNDRETCERIVSEVLEENLDLLVKRGDETRELSRLKASSDRRIRAESAKAVRTGTIGP